MGSFRLGERLKSDEQALLDGYKPAIASMRGRTYEDLKQLYPYIQSSVNPESLIFFQNESHKKVYLERTKNVVEGSPEFEYILGITLGFPERSARWFSQIMERKQELGELPPEKALYGIGVYWAGFSFVSHIEYVDEEIQELWNTYDHPKANENSLYVSAIGAGKYEISHGDLEQVRKVQREVMISRNLISTVSVNK